MDETLSTGPPSADDRHGERLLVVAKLMRAYVEIALRTVDLHCGQDELICCLDDEPRLTVGDIASRLHVSSSTISQMTNVLAAKGLVERAPHADDRRKITVVLTPTGLELQTRVHELFRCTEHSLFGELTTAEADDLRKGLMLLDGRLRECLDSRR